MFNKSTFSIIALTLFIVFFIPNLIFAANGNIKGKISSAQTNEPLPFSNVLLLQTSIGTATDKDGDYIIKGIPAGEYTLRASYIGYKQQEIVIKVVGGQTTELNIQLEPDILESETVVITAQAQGQLGAINEQLSSIEIKNVVSLSKIRELPDANASETVSRLPGVSLLRTGGEGSKVVVRGLSPQYNRVTIDGVELPGNVISNNIEDHKTELSGSDNVMPSGDRATDLSMISSNMLGGIEVIKAITPDMDATVLGGTVNFSMRKAGKNTNNSPIFELQSQGSYNGLKDELGDYKFSGAYEQRFLEKSLGVFVLGSIEERNLSGNELIGNYNYEAQTNYNSQSLPEFYSMQLSDVYRKRNRTGVTLVLDYEYEDGNIGLMNFFSRSKTNAEFRNEFYELGGNDGYYSATNSESTLDVFSNLLSVKHNILGFTIDAKFSHSYTLTDYPDDIKFNFWQDGVGFSGSVAQTLKYASTSEVYKYIVKEPSDAAFFDISNVNSRAEDRTFNAGLDLSTDITFTDYLSSKFKIGTSFQFRKRSYDYNQSSGSVFYDDGQQVAMSIAQAFPQLGNEITASDFFTGNYEVGEFLNGDYELISPIDIDFMLRVMDYAKEHPGIGNGGGYKEHKLASKIEDYHGDETRSAFYGMANINIGQLFTLVPGLRYQNLTTNYSGVRGEALPGGIQYTDATEKVSHGYYLPMVHLRFKPVDWFHAHFAYTNTLNYPDFNTIIPKYLIGTNSVSYNNYRLKPARSENFDLVFSVFTNEIGLFTLSGFKKNIKDLIFVSKSYPKDFSAYPELYEKLKNRTEQFSLFTFINNPNKIDLIGIETEWQTNLWYLPEPLNGIVFNINYTHIFSEAKYPLGYLVSYLDSNFIQQKYTVDTIYSDRLLNQPNDIMNISLGYDYESFSFRVSMLYQDNIFKNPNMFPQNRINSDKYVRFDLSVKQTLPWLGIQLFFNLNNITGEDDIDINQGNKFTTHQQRYGMSGDLGLRMNF